MRKVFVISLSLGISLLVASACGVSGAAKDNKPQAKPVSVKAKPATTPQTPATPAKAPEAAPKAPEAAPKAPEAAPKNPVVVKGWDFAKLDAKQKAEWVFPGTASFEADGACYQVAPGAPGPMLKDTQIDAANVTSVRVKVKAVRPDKDGKAQPVQIPAVIFYWATDEDIAASKTPDWPFSTARALALKKDVLGDATTWGIDLPSKPTAWKGAVKRIHFGIDVPPAAEGEKKACSLTVKSIEFLK